MDGITLNHVLLVAFAVIFLVFLRVVLSLDKQGRDADSLVAKPRERKRKPTPKRAEPSPNSPPGRSEPEVASFTSLLDERPEPPPIVRVSVEEAQYDEVMLGYINAGKKINAIKRYREITGMGLKESKDAVEAIAAGESPAASPASPARVNFEDALNDEQVRQFMEADRKLHAIKRFRELTGGSLKVSKEAVESLEVPPPPLPPDAGNMDMETALQDSYVRELILSGKRLKSIDRLRDLTGAEVQEIIEALVRVHIPAHFSSVPVDGTTALQDAELLSHLNAGKKILAVKRYRQLTQAGLKEAKDVIDNFERGYRGN